VTISREPRIIANLKRARRLWFAVRSILVVTRKHGIDSCSEAQRTVLYYCIPYHRESDLLFYCTIKSIEVVARSSIVPRPFIIHDRILFRLFPSLLRVTHTLDYTRLVDYTGSR
jgi:hypothetical protein